MKELDLLARGEGLSADASEAFKPISTNVYDNHPDVMGLTSEATGSSRASLTSLSSEPPRLDSSNFLPESEDKFEPLPSTVSTDSYSSSDVGSSQSFSSDSSHTRMSQKSVRFDLTRSLIIPNDSNTVYESSDEVGKPAVDSRESAVVTPTDELEQMSSEGPASSQRTNLSSQVDSAQTNRYEHASLENCGITDAHREAIAKVCQEMNIFLFIRPSTEESGRLIEQGFATKSMDIHDKSSDWGLGSGFVPCDPAFSKNLTGDPNPELDPHSHGAAHPTQLQLEDDVFNNLMKAGHFDVENITVDNGEEGLTYYKSDRNPNVAFVRDADGNVFWQNLKECEDGSLSVSEDRNKFMVWAYENEESGELNPVTGDYDMWMACPHESVTDDDRLISVEDSHGVSASTKLTQTLIDKLNEACGRKDNPVFHHGPEAANVSFTQKLDKGIAMFSPGTAEPRIITPRNMPHVLDAVEDSGYIAARNPKWIDGVTLGIEDMANAPDEFSEDPAVKGGKKEMRKLQNQAATSIQRSFRDSASYKSKIDKENVPSDSGESQQDFKARHKDLKPLRRVGKRTSPEERVFAEATNRGLPRDALPKDQPVGAKSAAVARQRSSLSEMSLKQAGFKDVNGHATPIDRSLNEGEMKKRSSSIVDSTVSTDSYSSSDVGSSQSFSSDSSHTS